MCTIAPNNSQANPLIMVHNYTLPLNVNPNKSCSINARFIGLCCLRILDEEKFNELTMNALNSPDTFDNDIELMTYTNEYIELCSKGAGVAARQAVYNKFANMYLKKNTTIVPDSYTYNPCDNNIFFKLIMHETKNKIMTTNELYNLISMLQSEYPSNNYFIVTGFTVTRGEYRCHDFFLLKEEGHDNNTRWIKYDDLCELTGEII